MKRRIMLPSGKVIEVEQYTAPLFGTPRAPRAPRTPAAPLHICPACTSPLVYPVAWEADGNDWWVARRCPDCEWRGEGIFPQDVCNRFDDALEDATEAITRAFERLARANMAEDVERFVHALAVDAVRPEDF